MSKIIYDKNHVPDRDKLPDPQKLHGPAVEGIGIPLVGINEFEIPVKYLCRDGEENVKLETSVSCYVNLGVEHKGINMSRLPRVLYKYINENGDVSLALMEHVLREFKAECNATRATLKFKFKFPYKQNSLRSKDESGKPLWGYNYYPCTLKGQVDENGAFRVWLKMDFVYSSTCPCSNELARNAEKERGHMGVQAIAHSQRSHCILKVEFDPKNDFWIEDMIDLLRDTLKTESQVMVKREDEQAFAELAGAYPKFVEDAARLVFEALNKRTDVLDFSSQHVHEESLHPHNAVAVIWKGIPGGLR